MHFRRIALCWMLVFSMLSCVGAEEKPLDKISLEMRREKLGDVFVPVESWGLLVNSFEELLMVDRNNENGSKLLNERLDDFLNIYIIDRWEFFTFFFVSLRFNCDGKMSLGKVIDSARSEDKIMLSKLIFNHIRENARKGGLKIAEGRKNDKQKSEEPLAPVRITEDLFDLLENIQGHHLKFPPRRPLEKAMVDKMLAERRGRGIDAAVRLHAMFLEIDGKKPIVNAIKNNEQGFIFVDDPLWGRLCSAYERLMPLYKKSSYGKIKEDLNELALAFVNNKDLLRTFFYCTGKEF